MNDYSIAEQSPERLTAALSNGFFTAAMMLPVFGL